jgi:long-chain acyl-CoA synthetase
MFLLDNNYPNRVALVCDDGTYVTYKELNDLIEKFSYNLTQKSLIFLLCKNDIDSIICYLTALRVGAVPLLLSENINKEQLNNLIKIYNPKYIFSKKTFVKNTYSIKNRLNKSNIFICDNYNDYKVHKDLALLLTTSGSTGSPKLVKLTKLNLISNAKSISEFLGINFKDRAITSLPFHYSYGLSVINSHLYSGGSIFLSSSSMIEEKFWIDINEHNITSIAGVPYNYEMMLRLGIKNLNIPTVKKMTQAGGKLDLKKIKQVNTSLIKKEIDFYIMYGQTEATARISFLPCEDISSKPNSIGISIPGGSLSLHDEKGIKIYESLIVGEMVYEGPNVFMGYANSITDLSIGDVKYGKLKTGDLAYFDEDGYYFIKGRKSRFVKVFGNRISLDYLEEIIIKKGFETAIIAEDDKIIIYLKNKEGLLIPDFRKEISEYLGINMVAIYAIAIKHFPRHESGKINYQELKRIS